MSDAEMHVLRARLRGGILNQARRGALKTALPVGLVYDAADNVVLDPDSQVRKSITHLFDTFVRTGSASATVRHFREQHLRFPRRPGGGPHKGELFWEELRRWRVLRVLHNPRYAGAFCFGRTRTHQRPGDTVTVERLSRDEWIALIPDAHPGYITWEQFESNLGRLRENAQAHGAERRKSPPREGPALLQGMVICGVCGRRMTVGYDMRKGRQSPRYACQSESIETATARCQSIEGSGIDEAIGNLLIETVTPITLEVALHVQAELETRAKEADALRSQRVERARHEADLARRRFMEADPGNRLVVDVLEAEWNKKLRAINDAQEELERHQTQHRQELDDEQRQQILALATDFPRLWNDPKTPQRERKRMVRLLLEDVTLTKHTEIVVGVRFRGGATRTLTFPLPKPAWQLRQTSAQVISEIDRLLDHHTEGQIATILNERGRVSGQGKPFHAIMVRRLRRDYRLQTRYDRLRAAGMLTLDEIADQLGVNKVTARKWRDHGLLRAHVYNDKRECLYEHPGDDLPVKKPGKKLSKRRRFPEVVSNPTKEVQCEA